MAKLIKSKPDKEILQNVIEALGVRIQEFREKIGYGTNTTIYNVLNETNGISSDMINRIITKYPEVSYLYLKKGEGHPIRIGPAVTNQKNILGLYDKNEFINIYDFFKLPSVVQELKEQVQKLKEEINQLKKSQLLWKIYSFY